MSLHADKKSIDAGDAKIGTHGVKMRKECHYYVEEVKAFKGPMELARTIFVVEETRE